MASRCPRRQRALALSKKSEADLKKARKAWSTPIVLRGTTIPDASDPVDLDFLAFREVGISRAGLLDLPAEILDQIFQLSGNLEFAYVCRQIWFSVSYTQLSKDLSLVAFFSSSYLDRYPVATRDEDHEILNHGTTGVFEKLSSLTWIGVPTYDVRVQLQEDLYRCLWFTERHLQQIRYKLLRDSIEGICERQKLSISQEQWSQIKDFLERNKERWTLPSDAGSCERGDILSFHPVDEQGNLLQGVLHPYYTMIWKCDASDGPCQDARTCSHISREIHGVSPDFAAPFRPINPECLIQDVGKCDQRAYDLVCAVFQLELFSAWANRYFWFNSISRTNAVINLRWFTSYPIHTHLICWMPSEVTKAVAYQLGEDFTDKNGESSHPNGDKCLDLLLNLGRHHELDICRTQAMPAVLMQRFNRFWRSCYFDALQSGNVAGIRRLLQFEEANRID